MQGCHGSLNGFRAMQLAQGQKPLFSGARCGHLREHIPFTFGGAANILHNDADLFGIWPFSGEKPQRR